MTETKEINVEQLLDDLSYSWSTPEAEDFHWKIREKKFDSAKRMLEKEDLNKEEVKAIMKYFKNKFSAKKKLTEYFSFEWNDFKEGDEVLVSYGGGLHYSKLYQNLRGEGLVFYTSRESVEIHKAIQIWKVEILEENE